MKDGYPALEERISPAYLDSQKELHSRPRGYGGGGHKWAAFVASLVSEEGHKTVLDYGAGQATLEKKLAELSPGLQIASYDPAIPELSAEPASADLVVCTDVLEHIEPERLDAVLRHILALADRAAFFVISLKEANKTLADGRNAHLIIESAGWWHVKLEEHFDIAAKWGEGAYGYGNRATELCVVARKKAVRS